MFLRNRRGASTWKIITPSAEREGGPFARWVRADPLGQLSSKHKSAILLRLSFRPCLCMYPNPPYGTVPVSFDPTLSEEDSRRRLMLNLSAVPVIAIAGFAVASPASANVALPNTC